MGIKAGTFLPRRKMLEGCRGVAKRYRSRCDFTGEHLRYSTKPRRECSLLVANTISPLCGNPVESRVVSFYPWHAADIVTFDLLAQGLYRPPTLYETYPPLQVSWNARQHALDFTDNDIRNERFRYCQHSDRILLHVDRCLHRIDLILIGSKVLWREKEREREKKRVSQRFEEIRWFYFRDYLDEYVCTLWKCLRRYVDLD